MGPIVRKIYMNWINSLVSFCIHSGFCIVKLTYIDVSFTMIYILKKKPMLLSCYYHKSRHYVTKCHVVDHESRGNILVQKRVRFFFFTSTQYCKAKKPMQCYVVTVTGLKFYGQPRQELKNYSSNYFFLKSIVNFPFLLSKMLKKYIYD